MNLYLLRHGDYVQAHDDSLRCLSSAGRSESKKIVTFMKSHNMEFDTIWHSSKLRSRQTAELFVDFNNEIVLEERSDLEPLSPVNGIVDDILNLRKNLLIVGHLPFIPNLISYLLFGLSNKDIFQIKTSSLLCMSFEGTWLVEGFISPDVLSS